MALTQQRPATPRHEAEVPTCAGFSAHRERELRAHARAARPPRLDRARPAELRRALAHRVQAEPGPIVVGQAVAVVGDLDRDRAVDLEPDAARAGAGVAGDV